MRALRLFCAFDIKNGIYARSNNIPENDQLLHIRAELVEANYMTFA